MSSSFEAATITHTNSSSLSYEEQKGLQSAQSSQQQILNTSNTLHIKMSLLSATTNVTNADKNTTTVLETNTNQNASENRQSQISFERIMPNIYLTKDFISWNEEQLRRHGFTHIIIIDKHIQELYYPNQQPDIFKLFAMGNTKNINLRHDNGSSLDAFDSYYQPTTNHLSFGKEFEVIDLNFGDKSYLTTVLPNCYKAVKFVSKALQAGGTILVIDCNGGEQKCVTIIVAYLMYKYNINFSNAFARLKEYYNKADLDRFYISQLYEYEPILQVQRAQSRGHSSSRKLHAAILKRKKAPETDDETSDTSPLSDYMNINTSTYSTTTTELLNNCNPLNRFNSTEMERNGLNPLNQPNAAMATVNGNTHTVNRFMSIAGLPLPRTGDWYNWDDCAME